MPIQRPKGFTLVELMIVVAIIGLLSSIAAVGFMRFQQRARQSEVKANLKGVFTAQSAYFAEREAYSAYFSEIGFDPERGNRYAYYIGSGKVEARNGAAKTAPADGYINVISADSFKFGGTNLPAFDGTVVGTLGSNGSSFTAVAAANIDTDPGVDSWQITSVSSEHTATCGGEESRIVSGVPYNDFNDVGCD